MSDKNKNSGDVIASDENIPTRTPWQRLLAICIVVFTIAGSVYAAKLILASKPKARQRTPAKISTVVETKIVEQTTKKIYLSAMGTVLSSRTIALKPSVPGTVEYVSSNLVPGGQVKEGEVLVKIDARDYQLTYERKKNDLESAQMDLRLEEGSQAVAKREYELIKEYSGDALKDASIDLALRKPQLAKAKAKEAVAKTEIKIAQLDLERTELVAPFNSIVLDKSVEQGSQLNTQSTVATLAGTDTYWIRVSLPHRDLSMIKLPWQGQTGSRAAITNISQSYGSEEWKGNIIRVLPDVDPEGLMARVLIGVDNPLRPLQGELPLLLGSVVKVEVEGKSIENCFAVPRRVIRPDGAVLIASPDDTLDIRQVFIAWQNDEFAYVTEGLQDGEKLIVSNVAAPIQGMPLILQSR